MSIHLLYLHIKNTLTFPKSKKRIKIVFFTFYFILIVKSLLFAQNSDNNKITLQLKWKNQFQFAGYYAAIEKGFYKEVGLDVEVRELEKYSSVIDIVLRGNAQYGIGNSELILHYMQGDPIVVIASIIQNSPTAIVVKSSSSIYGPKDLVNKKIEINIEESGVEIMAMLQKEGVSIDQIKTERNSFSLNNLLSNKIDAQEIYTSNEPFFLAKFGIPFRLISPRDYGINFYSDCLFTTRDEINNNPERVRKFRLASIKGWEYALSHPEEIANLIQTKYHSIKTLDHLLFEAEEIRKLTAPEFIQMGHTNKERWLNIFETLSQQGLITNYRDINNFVYDPEYDSTLYKTRILMVVILLLFIALAITGYLYYKTKNTLIRHTNEFNSLSKRYESQLREVIRLSTEVSKSKNNQQSN